MGIYSALTNAVTGLRAQSYALENISGNIANSQTTGFKRIDTSFEDLVPDLAASAQVSGSVLASARSTNSTQGDIQTASNPTYMAINGDGFFAVQKPSNYVDGHPVFNSVNLYSRRGDFAPNKEGYLVNGAGYYLMGIPLDSTTGNPVGSTPQTLKFSNDFLPAVATTELGYHANLPGYPRTQSSDPAVPGSELLKAANFTTNPLIAGAGTVIGSENDAFLKSTISGGSITAYDAAGTPASVQLRWGKVDSATSGGTDTWQLFYQTNSTATGNTVAWKNSGQSYAFNASGQLNPAVPSITLTGVTIDGVALGTLKVQHDVGGITQFADSNGTVQVNSLDQNGYAAGNLNNVAINDKGELVGTYSNGRNVKLATISVATFNGTDQLKRLDGGAFAATDESGPALFGSSGSIVASALESSNTDISDEFTKLIVTQQAYTANTKVVTTSNDMVQAVLNMIR